MRRALAMAALVALLAGCAVRPVAAPPVSPPAPPAASAPSPPPERPTAGDQVGTTASGGSITVHQAPVVAVRDSTPSEEALEVLRTIPDPLPGGDPPDTVQVPVPAPTQPLGDRPGTRPITALPESLAATEPRPPAAPPAAPAGGSTAGTDSCWRVQVLAPPERDRAERMAEAARSQLLVPFVVEREGGLFKVRSRDCLAAGAANDLRRRAAESGFAGAFRFLPKKP